MTDNLLLWCVYTYWWLHQRPPLCTGDCMYVQVTKQETYLVYRWLYVRTGHYTRDLPCVRVTVCTYRSLRKRPTLCTGDCMYVQVTTCMYMYSRLLLSCDAWIRLDPPLVSQVEHRLYREALLVRRRSTKSRNDWPTFTPHDVAQVTSWFYRKHPT